MSGLLYSKCCYCIFVFCLLLYEITTIGNKKVNQLKLSDLFTAGSTQCKVGWWVGRKGEGAEGCVKMSNGNEILFC